MFDMLFVQGLLHAKRNGIQLTLFISNIYLSKYLSRHIKNKVWINFPFCVLTVHPKLLIFQSKFSGTRKFTLKYQDFEMNFDFEISRVVWINNKNIVLPDETTSS